MPNNIPNSTDYIHPNEPNLVNLHKAMEYDTDGKPVVRTRIIDGITIDNITIDNVEISNDIGNPIPVTNIDQSFNVRFPEMQTDAFGRFKTSSPLTLFDSFHRYADNNTIETATNGTASVNHSETEGLINCTIGTNATDFVKRESSRVFFYQPGKSLTILQTFTLNPPKNNLRQRYGYFNELNGIFLEQEHFDINFVLRSQSSGTVVNQKINQSLWNYDKMDGTGPSGYQLDLTNSQILFIDIEWLGVGSVRVGFIINGEYHICHKFHHANLITGTYMSTACLPVRAEIENIGPTSTPSNLKIICSSVISDGGYELRGRTFTAGHDISSPYNIHNSDQIYPLMSIRLKSNRLDAIILPKTINLVVTGNANYQWYIYVRSITTGGVWQSDPISSVEYNITPTAISNGKLLESGYLINTNQTSSSPNLRDTPFKYQLERNSFLNVPYELVLCAKSTGTNQSAWANIVWDEIT